MCKKCQAKSKIGKMKRRKRSRVSGISSVVPTLTTAALAAAGLYAANKVSGLSFMPKNNYVKAGIQVAAGIALTMIKGNAYTTPVGVGMAAAGVMSAASEAGLKGIGQQRTYIAGYDSPAMQQQPVAVFQ